MKNEEGIHSCKDCKDRCVGCHVSCEKYRREKNDFEKIKTLQKEKEKIDGYFKRRNANIATFKIRKNKTLQCRSRRPKS